MGQNIMKIVGYLREFRKPVCGLYYWTFSETQNWTSASPTQLFLTNWKDMSFACFSLLPRKTITKKYFFYALLSMSEIDCWLSGKHPVCTIFHTKINFFEFFEKSIFWKNLAKIGFLGFLHKNVYRPKNSKICVKLRSPKFPKNVDLGLIWHY